MNLFTCFAALPSPADHPIKQQATKKIEDEVFELGRMLGSRLAATVAPWRRMLTNPTATWSGICV
ncbi:hypothetical protein ACXWPL_09805, partial [Streptococcus pyogenes]